ncbi:multiheme c-type cytochrome [Teredinibacter sp. KSP-S5-2]|uniref:multiheme c-type cytochrome n=1 Tax=Teredinibacter sp. KSP-S5-2 TaxID=3034506 RepID=UPI002934DBF4|nr:multiheme c-type cytochrome [Teredinibacter sp. KSP-S5-2]WNO11435.1 multiheme c-type cytochrome [Teredinibacter sp. KSP-S5-2]
MQAVSVSANSGSEECASCHTQQFSEWKSSHHFHAMAEINSATNVGEFLNQTIEFDGAKATFKQIDGQYFIDMPNVNGKQVEYRVTHTFGYYPLQQYMFEEGRGKFQYFPYAWDSRSKEEGGQRWFVLHPDHKPNDEFHWTQMGQNWNQMCADCHSTEFKKGFDLESMSYQSTYDEINVGCAACHGDSTQHMRWAAGETSIADKGYPDYIGSKTPLFKSDGKGSMTGITALKSSKQIDICAACHSRRTPFEDRALPEHFYETYQPSLLTSELYHLDGQIWDEDYVWGSLLQSKKYQAGVTCTNCHNPHSGNLKLPGNYVCTQCHEANTYDVTAHHGHQADTQGAYCVDCHMPATTYMQVDDRRDHAFKIPRPDLTQSLGVPNACNDCHEDKTPAWSERAILQWHPDSKYIGSEHFAQAFHKAELGTADSGRALSKIAQDGQTPDIIRASALQRMALVPGRDAMLAIIRGVRDENPLMRQAAIVAAVPYSLSDRWPMLNTLLNDDLKPIRTEAARALAGSLVQAEALGLVAVDKKRLQDVLEEYREVQTYAADRGSSHTNLGNLEKVLGHPKNAEKHYRKAIEVEPAFIPAYVNLADLYREWQNENQVQDILSRALTKQPKADSVLYAMAMSFVRSGNKEKAVKYLQSAANGAEPNPSIVYTYALLLQDIGNRDASIEQFQRAYTLNPSNPDINYSLALNYQAKGDYSNALRHAKKLAQLIPNNPQIKQLVRQLESQNKGTN